jgi:uncharacterized protein (DUF2344 family)
MKIFIKPKPTYFIRLQIRRAGEQTKYISLIETTIEETQSFIKNVINENKKDFDPFGTTKKTSVDIREALGTENGKSKSVSFFGFSTNQVYELITNKLK